MNPLLMKWALLFAMLMVLMDSSHASWSIGSKVGVNGPIVHSTYFLTPNNAPAPVSAQAYVGAAILNGNCQYTAVYNLGTEVLNTGDTFYVDAYLLKNLINGGYTCMSVYYTYKQLVIDTFQLTYDGINYITSNPQTDEITIL